MNHNEQAHGILAEHVRQYVESYASAHTLPEGVRMGVKHSRKGVKHPTEPRQDSLGNFVDPNVRVTVAVENKYGIDGHRHTLLPKALLR